MERWTVPTSFFRFCSSPVSSNLSALSFSLSSLPFWVSAFIGEWSTFLLLMFSPLTADGMPSPTVLGYAEKPKHNHITAIAVLVWTFTLDSFFILAYSWLNLFRIKPPLFCYCLCVPCSWREFVLLFGEHCIRKLPIIIKLFCKVFRSDSFQTASGERSQSHSQMLHWWFRQCMKATYHEILRMPWAPSLLKSSVLRIHSRLTLISSHASNQYSDTWAL